MREKGKKKGSTPTKIGMGKILTTISG